MLKLYLMYVRITVILTHRTKVSKPRSTQRASLKGFNLQAANITSNLAK
jgi:hypothetical protein